MKGEHRALETRVSSFLLYYGMVGFLIDEDHFGCCTEDGLREARLLVRGYCRRPAVVARPGERLRVAGW